MLYTLQVIVFNWRTSRFFVSYFMLWVHLALNPLKTDATQQVTI